MFEQVFKNIDDVLRKEAGCTTELDYTEQTSWLLFLKYLAPRISLARAWMHQEKWPEAIAELEEAAGIDPAHPEPHLMLARIFFRAGDEQRAAREKEIALRLRRENPHSVEAVQGRPFPR